MIDPVSSASTSLAYSVNGSRADSVGQAGSSANRDVVSISDEALRKYAAGRAGTASTDESEQDAARAEGSPWKLPGGLAHSERTLKNGHTEIIDIDGGTLTVREYDGDKLVKSVDGTMGDERAVLDTTYYDETGKVSQTIHAEMARIEEKGGWTGAVMNRSVTWYKDGQVERTLGDEMYMRTRNTGQATISLSGNEFSRMTEDVDGDADTLVLKLTNEDHSLSYHADIQEFYDNKQLARNIVIDQTGEFTQESNRHGVEVGGMGPLATRELHHDTRLSVVSEEYDRDGELLREATVTDASEDGVGDKNGEQYQTADVSWYKDGELVKHGRGSFRLEEFAGHKLMKRPGVLDLLGLKPEEYLTPEAQDSSELLGTKLEESSSAPEFFLEGLGRAVAKGQYGSAADMAEYGRFGQPFDADWTTELYEDGEMVMRKQDSHQARNAPERGVDDRLPFRTVAGLSDGDRPAVLQHTSHTTEILENGKTVARESQETREFLQPDEHGPDTLMTLAGYNRLNDNGDDGVNVVYKGGIDAADPDSSAALRSLGEELDLTMDVVYEAYRDARGRGNFGDKASGFRFNGFDQA
ncbi:hypothetical protein BerOc1_01010 [Pseudodesulfovibrio hydrargyri]|uniref:Uncharacterized protein n=1 Tax=Pseudodesulfovibrio hydrargyri TaxID=2125990 RepID=A0A1J5MSW6_9BACT|nr:hypothetical protein [Pseudodesulfovibrio hydrargyri]OIQ49090.1 hypothetical protein BerOc1_01010 [Pseudodesulfovibrio hydrargyri]